jgi:hypothetical protein
MSLGHIFLFVATYCYERRFQSGWQTFLYLKYRINSSRQFLTVNKIQAISTLSQSSWSCRPSLAESSQMRIECECSDKRLPFESSLPHQCFVRLLQQLDRSLRCTSNFLHTHTNGGRNQSSTSGKYLELGFIYGRDTTTALTIPPVTTEDFESRYHGRLNFRIV